MPSKAHPPDPQRIREASLNVSGIADAADYLAEKTRGDFQTIAAALAKGSSEIQRLEFHLAVLDAQFYKLMRQADMLPPETALAYLELALKFQAAIRKTAQAIATMKAPPPQPSAIVKTYIESQLNQLVLGDVGNAPMDTRGAIEAGREDQAVVTLAALDRTLDAGGEDQMLLEFAQPQHDDRINPGSPVAARVAREYLRKVRPALENIPE